MKFTVLLMLCLLVGILARPEEPRTSAPLINSNLNLPSLIEGDRVKRSTESDSSESGSSSSENALVNISKQVRSLITQITNGDGLPIPSDISALISDIFNGNLSLDRINSLLNRDNINRLVEELNPLDDVLRTIPVVGPIYESTVDYISAGLSSLVSILLEVAEWINRILSAISGMVPLPLPSPGIIF